MQQLICADLNKRDDVFMAEIGLPIFESDDVKTLQFLPKPAQLESIH